MPLIRRILANIDRAQKNRRMIMASGGSDGILSGLALFYVHVGADIFTLVQLARATDFQLWIV